MNQKKQKSSAVSQQEYISMLEKLLTFISHNISKPMAHIHGISYIETTAITDSTTLLNKKLMYMKQSAILLDKKAKDLSVLIFKKVIRLKKQDIN